MNAALRKDEGADAVAIWEEFALHLSRALKKLRTLNVPLYRGLDRRVLAVSASLAQPKLRRRERVGQRLPAS